MCSTVISSLHRLFSTSAVNSFILAHSQEFVKNFFHFFFKMFEVSGIFLFVLRVSLETACISYYTKTTLSTTFFSFFLTFSPLGVLYSFFSKNCRFSRSYCLSYIPSARKLSHSRLSPARYRLMTVQIPTPASP